jgi:S-adenosylmethionine-diacylglycerol 3-amino-3-carboxypropyl transferase
VPPYLEPAAFETVRDHAYRVRVENRSLTDLLAEAPDGSRDVYVLLDAQDWMNDAQLNALWREITRTADKGARVLFRTGGAAGILPGRVHPVLLDQWQRDGAASETAFANDRSAIYGGVHLYRRLDR